MYLHSTGINISVFSRDHVINCLDVPCVKVVTVPYVKVVTVPCVKVVTVSCVKAVIVPCVKVVLFYVIPVTCYHQCSHVKMLLLSRYLLCLCLVDIFLWPIKQPLHFDLFCFNQIVLVIVRS